ncbi:MAG: NUDIX hydrolase [Planctomycetota bacterium]|jgi:8-oxo-dGTP pyrophosphatase MutT (NUDIX family)
MVDISVYRLAASIVVRDADGRILIVREADPRVRGKLNLPGGHMDPGETAVACALRELREETGVSAELLGLVGVYTNAGGVFFVFLGRADKTTTTPGQDILACEWLSPDEIAALPDEQILRPKKFRRIMSDVLSGRSYPTDVIQRLEREERE